ncbi:MAG: ATP-binding protein [Magnetococcus sp. DMHC-1]
MNTGSRIGAYVLDTLTTGMYRTPLDTVREYVANARDSIVEALEQGLIKNQRGRIRVIIDSKQQSLSIIDTGVGIPCEHAYQRLVNVGMSSKSATKSIDRLAEHKSVGFRGIGRLAGIAYCDQLEFYTSAINESKETVVRFDCVALRKGISNTTTSSAVDATVLLDRCVSTETKEASNEDHYFKVRMLGVYESCNDLLDSNKLCEYLSQNASVSMDAHRFIYVDKIKNYMEDNNKISIPDMDIVIEKNGKQKHVVFRPYKTTYYTSKKERIDIKDVEFIEPTQPGLGYWGWYGKSNLAGQIDDVVASGIRIRMQGIGFGDADLMAEIFRDYAISSERLNGWYIGEIHIHNPDVIPNGRRDGFEETDSWIAIRKDLKEHAGKLSRFCYNESESRNVSKKKADEIADKEISKIDRFIKTGVSSDEKREELLADLAKVEDNLERRKRKALKIRGEDEAIGINQAIERVKKKGEELRNIRFVSSDLEIGMSREEKVLLRKILKAIQSIFDNENYLKAYNAIKEILEVKKERKKRD